MLNYKGYFARVVFDADANVLHGEVLGTRDVITFQATSVDDLRREFEESVDDYLAFCAERNEKPEKPFAGRIALRIDHDTHRRVSIAAAAAGVSLSSWIATAIKERLDGQVYDPSRIDLPVVHE